MLKLFLIWLIFFVSLIVKSQDVDSLYQIIDSKKLKYNQKSDAFQSLIDYYTYQNLDSAVLVAKQWLRQGELHKDTLFLASALKNMAEVELKLARYSSSLDHFNKALTFYTKLEDKNQSSDILKRMGYVYEEQHDAENAVKHYLKALDIKEKIGDKKGMASVYNGIGTLYYSQKNYKEALKYYNKGLIIVSELEMKVPESILKMNIGNIYCDIFLQNDSVNLINFCHYDSFPQAQQQAILYYTGSLEIAKASNLTNQLPKLYTNLGLLDTVNALDYFLKSYQLRKQSGEIQGQWLNLYNIAGKYEDKADFKNALKYSREAFEFAKELNHVEDKAKSHKQLAFIYYTLGDFRRAYENISYYIELNDSLSQVRNQADFAELEKKWNYEKKEKENELLKKGKELDDERIAKQRLYLWASGLGLMLFGFLIFFILRGYRQKQKANQLLSAQKAQIEEANEELNQQNEEIAAQRDQIQDQKEHIEDIHREVSESIDYAKRLQGSILPKPELLIQHLPDHFVLFMPKDKVSGDFYWWTVQNEKLIVTAADCTGHGVPGAFMSMLGVSFLKEIVTKEFITQPSIILNHLRQEIIKTLGQKGQAGEQKDGMDMCLVQVDYQTQQVQFAAANNPLYIISNRNYESITDGVKVHEETFDSLKLYELKSDKMPIAIYEKMDDFTNHTLNLAKGDRLFMFSDGFADQFGGPKGKKFMYKNFKSILLNTATLSMTEQKNRLKSAFEDWKGQGEQIDDVVVIGLQL